MSIKKSASGKRRNPISGRTGGVLAVIGLVLACAAVALGGVAVGRMVLASQMFQAPQRFTVDSQPEEAPPALPAAHARPETRDPAK